MDTARAYMLPGTGAKPLPAHLEVVLEETRDHIVTVYNIVAFAENTFYSVFKATTFEVKFSDLVKRVCQHEHQLLIKERFFKYNFSIKCAC